MYRWISCPPPYDFRANVVAAVAAHSFADIAIDSFELLVKSELSQGNNPIPELDLSRSLLEIIDGISFSPTVSCSTSAHARNDV